MACKSQSNVPMCPRLTCHAVRANDAHGAAARLGAAGRGVAGSGALSGALVGCAQTARRSTSTWHRNESSRATSLRLPPAACGFQRCAIGDKMVKMVR